MPSKFQRQYIMTVEGSDGSTYTFQYPTTMQFSIRKGVIASAQTGRFMIKNVPPPTRNSIFKSRFQFNLYRKITLQAGYLGSPLSTIFNGNISECVSYREEGTVDVITIIDAYDMSYPMANCFSNGKNWKNASAQPTKQEVIENLVGDLTAYNVSRGTISKFPGPPYSRGYSPNGYTWDTLVDVTDRHCFMNDSKVYCLNDADCISGNIPILDSTTGLLGTPKVTDVWLMIQSLFEPRIILGQQIALQSSFVPAQFNQTYKVTGFSHEGIISGTVNGKCKTLVQVALYPNLTLLS